MNEIDFDFMDNTHPAKLKAIKRAQELSGCYADIINHPEECAKCPMINTCTTNYEIAIKEQIQ